ncbi:MAG TPA: hypothetical protein VJT73_05220 [Polyangiaceae bacterium]|nr:hypothetical protein [Polyangiaceae bacterium]
MNHRGPGAPRPPRAPHLELFPRLDRAWPSDGLGPIAVLVAQLPDPGELPEGALILVRESGPKARGLRRWIGAAVRIFQKPRRAHTAVRCTALLARGYRDIASAIDPKTGEALVWATSSVTSGRSSSAP